MSKPPNILFLMSDEHRADVTGFEGNTVIRTPVLDSLAEDGVVFENCYTPSPVCVPARQCMAAGQLPRTCGCEKYGDDLPYGHMTFPLRFSQYGYNTTCCGKIHQMGPDQMGGWMRRAGMDHMLEHARLEHIPGRQVELRKKYAAANTQNDGKWDDVKEIKRAGTGLSLYTEWDEYATWGAEVILREYFSDPWYDKTQSEYPHLFYVGFNNPHYPYISPDELFEYYINRVEPFYNEEPFDHPFLGNCPFSRKPLFAGKDGDVTERELRRATAAYYANIEDMDRRCGRVLDALKKANENPDDWIIIYTTDHGEMLGQHAVWEKQKFFEASARVPLVIRFPGGFKGGRRIQENVNLCDLFATLCELCDIPMPEGTDSRSLVPLLNGNSSNWDNETISQFRGTNLMIKQDHLKYQYYGEEMPEVLFDLKKNPDEDTNFINDPAYKKEIERFRKRRAELAFGPDADPNYTNAGYGKE